MFLEFPFCSSVGLKTFLSLRKLLSGFVESILGAQIDYLTCFIPNTKMKKRRTVTMLLIYNIDGVHLKTAQFFAAHASRPVYLIMHGLWTRKGILFSEL
jgi:hypothetical protein